MTPTQAEAIAAKKALPGMSDLVLRHVTACGFLVVQATRTHANPRLLGVADHARLTAQATAYDYLDLCAVVQAYRPDGGGAP